jgi:hypothetical protein
MKTTLALIGIAISFSVNSMENEIAKSVDVHNLSQIEKNIWVDGNVHSIAANSSLWVPCLPEEKVEIQNLEMLETLDCGETMELRK